jgi:hypothetical protein
VTSETRRRLRNWSLVGLLTAIVGGTLYLGVVVHEQLGDVLFNATLV